MPMTIDQWLRGAQLGAQAGEEGMKEAAAARQAKLADLLKGQAQQRDIAALQQMKASGLIPEGAGAHAGEAGIQPGYGMRLGAQQGGKFYGAANKETAPIVGQLNTLEKMHRLLDDPNAVGNKQLGANLARITEGQGQRLLQALVVSLGAPESVQGDAIKMKNWLLGSSQSGLSADQINAIRKNLFTNQSILEDEWEQSKGKLAGMGQAYASYLPPEERESTIRSVVDPGESVLGKLRARRSAFEKESSSKAVAPPGTSQVAGPQGPIDRARTFASNALSNVSPGLSNFLKPAVATTPSEQEDYTNAPSGMTREQFKQWKAPKGQ